MKIGIDASQIVFDTGVSFYTSNLLRGLSEIDDKDEFVVFGSSLRLKSKLVDKIKALKLRKNFKTKIYSLPPLYFEIFWNQAHLGKIENYTGEVNIFHASDWTQPPVKKAKLVTTIHDLAVLKYPQFFPPRILRNQKLRLNWVKKEAEAIIAVSQATKKDIVKLLKIDPQKIHVIYEAVPLEHQIKVDKNEIEKIKKQYGLQDYLLFVGTQEPRKNLKRVMEAVSPIHQLVIVGKRGWGGESLKFPPEARLATGGKFQSSKIKFLEQVTDKEVAALYGGAKCFVYPSLYEGFGLPVLEAMFYGCPVVTSNISSLPEVAGEAAILVNPNDVREISQAINKIINKRSIYNSLREKGFKQVKKFSWQKTAEQTLEVYREVGKC